MRILPNGSQIARYEVVRAIGEGAFGVVYLARHISLGYEVAIKEYIPTIFATRTPTGVVPISPEFQQEFQLALDKFIEESELLAQLDHPNIVQVYDCFIERGTAYMVMQYQTGVSIFNSYLEHHKRFQRAFTFDELKPILPGIFKGLAYMHRLSLVHRDIKPSNIFIGAKGRLHPMIIDFGTAKVSGGINSHYSPSTEGYAGLEQETPIYPLGPWTDVHAVGVMMTVLLTGEPPVSAQARQQALYKSQFDPMENPLHKISIQYGKAFAKVLSRSIALEPSNRFQDIPSFSNALGIRID